MDVAVKDRVVEEGRKAGGERPFDFMLDSEPRIEVSDTTRDAIKGDAWGQFVESGHAICDTTKSFDASTPETLSESDLLRINDWARSLARSTQTLLAIAREDDRT
jgi:hypothetical protein